MLIALIVSSDLVESVSRYPWQDNETSWRQRGGLGGGQKLDMTGPHTDVILETHMSESTRI